MASPYALDFSPLAQGIDATRQEALARNQLAMQQERLGFEREMQPFKVAQARQQVDAGQMEFEKAMANRFAGLGQMMQAEPDEAKRRDMLGKIYASDPRIKTTLGKYLPPEVHDDPIVVSRYWEAVARGYQDPEKAALVRSEAAKNVAEANKAGYVIQQPGTNLVSIAPPSPVGAAAANKAAGQGAPPPGTVISSVPLRPPPGYELDPTKPGSGEYRPLVGGPADIKFTEAKNKALFAAQSSASKIDDLVQNIEELQKHPGLKGNFGVEGAFPNWPGSQSSDAFAKLQQLKAQGGFAMLQAMRDASKTGGALGNVSDAEGARLEAAFGALQRASSLPQAMQELEKIKAQAMRSKSLLMQAYDRQYGASTPAQTPTRSAEIPEGQPGSRTSPVYPKTPADAAKLPRGAYFLTPEGELRQRK